MKKKLGTIPLVLITALVVTSCGNNTGTGTAAKNDSMQDNAAHDTAATAGITSTGWGETDGKKVSLFTLTNKNGVQATITNYGGTITSWLAPDRNGNKGNIVLGFD